MQEEDLIPAVDPPKRRGRPPGSKNSPKESTPTRSIPWFNIWRSVFWGVVAITSISSLYRGVEGWIGQSIAYVVLAVAATVAALLLDRDWKKMRSGQ